MRKLAIFAVMFFMMLVPFVALGASVTLEWDANTESDLAGYKIYYGQSTGTYDQVVDVGNVTTYTIQNLADGPWFFTATAYDTSGNESGYSNEASTAIDTISPTAPKNLRVGNVSK